MSIIGVNPVRDPYVASNEINSPIFLSNRNYKVIIKTTHNKVRWLCTHQVVMFHLDFDGFYSALYGCRLAQNEDLPFSAYPHELLRGIDKEQYHYQGNGWQYH